MKIVNVTTLSIALIMSACDSSNAPVDDTAPIETPVVEVPIVEPPEVIVPETKQELWLRLVNEQRAEKQDCGSYGIQPIANSLSWSDELEDASYEHSTDMSETAFFSHTGSGTEYDLTAVYLDNNGSHFSDRIYYNDYKGQPRAENIANGYKTAEAAMQGWMKSDGHCKNIMLQDITNLGMAKVNNYWTQNFGKRR